MIHYYFLLVLILFVSLLAHHLLLTVWNRRTNGEIIYGKQTANSKQQKPYDLDSPGLLTTSDADERWTGLQRE